MAVKSKKKQRATSERSTSAPVAGLAQPVDANAQVKRKGKDKNKKGKQGSEPANGALVPVDRESNGRPPAFDAAALENPDANVRWPVLLLRQGLLLAVERIDARYGIGRQHSEPNALDTTKRGDPLSVPSETSRDRSTSIKRYSFTPLSRPRGWSEAGAAMSRFGRSDRLSCDESQRRGVARVR